MSTLADQFKAAKENHYRFDLEAFMRSGGPMPWERKRGKTFYCQFQVTFKDGSKISCIMTLRQNDSIHRSKIYDTIKCIGGEGYRAEKALVYC